jgi:hypothetical protein
LRFQNNGPFHEIVGQLTPWGASRQRREVFLAR